MGDAIPDAKTIWTFRERLKELGLAERLFARFGEHLKQCPILHFISAEEKA